MTRKKDTDLPQKLRIKIKGYDTKLVDTSSRQIIDTVERHDGKIVGPIPLPTEFKRYTVNRSTFVHKNSREQFELRVHKRLIEIMNPTQRIVEALGSLNLPAGVDIEMKMA